MGARVTRVNGFLILTVLREYAAGDASPVPTWGLRVSAPSAGERGTAARRPAHDGRAEAHGGASDDQLRSSPSGAVGARALRGRLRMGALR